MNGMATLLALYQVTIPVAQVAVNEALVLLQMVGFIVPVGVVITGQVIVNVAGLRILVLQIKPGTEQPASAK